jgi:hypothetical protein
LISTGQYYQLRESIKKSGHADEEIIGCLGRDWLRG